ncbi:MAG: SDR family NAD(P)-dependent oxidoreductase [Polyangiaceae bacterium]
MSPARTARTVLITGASSGLGEALAVEYGSRGAHVALLARREDELARVAARVQERGGRATTIPVDVCDPDAVFAAVKRAEAELGGLDVVIANAGVGSSGHASRLQWADVARTVDVNVRGAMATLVAAIPIMLAQQHGHLVGVTSLAGKRALPESGAYSASKAALSTFLETLRLDLGPAGIQVTDVQPGFVATPINEHSKHPKPFLWQVDKAARVIANRLEKAPAVVSFPWPLVMLTSLFRGAPAWLYDRLVRASRG